MFYQILLVSLCYNNDNLKEVKNFKDITENQISRRNVAVSIPYINKPHIPIVRVTDKALCLEFDQSSWIHKSTERVWLPISQIQIEKTYTTPNFVDSDLSNENENCLYFEIKVPIWLLNNLKK